MTVTPPTPSEETGHDPSNVFYKSLWSQEHKREEQSQPQGHATGVGSEGPHLAEGTTVAILKVFIFK